MDDKTKAQMRKRLLRERLRERIEEQKYYRKPKSVRQKISIKMQNDKRNLVTVVEAMMEDVKQPKFKKLSFEKKLCQLEKKYPVMIEKYSYIVRAVLHGNMSLPMLKMILAEKEKIDSRQMTQEEADKKMGLFLFNKYRKDKK